MDQKSIEDYLLSLEDVTKTFPFGEDIAVFEVHNEMFALLSQKHHPVRLSLKCDPRLSALLRAQYETVMPGDHLNQKHWNTIILTGQLTEEEVDDLIRHSYILVRDGDQK